MIPNDIKEKTINDILKSANGSWRDLVEDGFDAGVNYIKEELTKKDERIKELEEGLQTFIEDPYPVDVFLPVTKEELKDIHKMLEDKFNMPLDRLMGHFGRILRKPLREMAQKLLNH